MSKLVEAAQAAVKAFEEHGYSPLTIKAIWALRDALAEPAEDGWRRCAVGQGETQHCALLEAAVAAEREACAAICDRFLGANACGRAIRARGQE